MIFIKGVKKATVDMADLLKAVKAEQQRSLQQDIEERNARSQRSAIQSSNVTPPTEVQHGDIVEMEDGSAAIYIDHQTELKKIQNVDKTRTKLMNLVNQSSVLIMDENQEYVLDTETGQQIDPGVKWLKENPFDVRASDMRKIKKGFASLTYGIRGLVPIQSEEGKIVEEAISKVRSGEVILPSPEEYEIQRQAAEERKRARMERLRNKAKENIIDVPEKKPRQTPKPQKQSTQRPKEPQPVQQYDIELPKLQMADAPKHANIQKGAIEQLMENTLNPQGMEESVQTNPPVSKPRTRTMTVVNASDEPIGMPIPNEQVSTEQQVSQEPDTKAVESVTPQPVVQRALDMFAVQEKIAEAREAASTEEEFEESVSETVEESDIVHISVAKGEAKEFAKNMPESMYSKIQASTVVQLEEVDMVKVPTATRRISDIAEYRRLNSRRPANEVGELAERALVNSGIVITVKSATSIEQATIFNGPTANDVDLEKAYEFCYTHTVNTSIGKVSFNEYKELIHPYDLDTVLEGIYSISEQPERTVNMNCILEAGGCGASFELKVKSNTIQDTDTFPKESLERIKEIVSVKDVLEKAKELQESSPAATVRVILLGDRYISVRSTNINRILAMNALEGQLKRRYPVIILALLVNVDSITIETWEEGATEPTVSLIDDVLILAEELSKLSDTELTLLKEFLMTIKEYRPMTYSIKGPYSCPICGKVYKRAALDSMTQLIFQTAQATWT